MIPPHFPNQTPVAQGFMLSSLFRELLSKFRRKTQKPSEKPPQSP